MFPRVTIPYLISLGNYAVLVDANQKETTVLEANENFVPALSEELSGFFWRKIIRPDYAKLARRAMADPGQSQAIADELAAHQDRRRIFFSTHEIVIEKFVVENSFGTITSKEALLEKDFIILLGSEGKRKYGPLKEALSQLMQNKKIGIVGLPAESGVNMQPVGHAETYQGSLNRLAQLQNFRLNLQKIFGAQPPQIFCLAIENGIGLYPVEDVPAQGHMLIAGKPLQSVDGTTFHFYDQAHLLLDDGQHISHRVSRPTRVLFTLMNKDEKELAKLFIDHKPQPALYLLLSQWSQEMLRRLKSSQPQDAFPLLEMAGKTFTSEDLIR